MDGYQFAAIVGALSWSVPIGKLIFYLLSKPNIGVVTSKTPEVGYSTLGPIFNLRLAFSVENKDIVLSSVRVVISHESGEKKAFSWQGITQNLGQLESPENGTVPFKKEGEVLAVKITQDDILERFIRFQDEQFIHKKQEYIDVAEARRSHLKATDQYDDDAFLQSEEMRSLYQFTRTWSYWREGSYTAVIELESPNAFELSNNQYRFSLTSLDIERLEMNKDFIEKSYENTIKEGQEGYESEEPPWHWSNPRLIKD